MSSPARRAEKERERLRESEEREQERLRKAGRAMWQRIEESNADEEVKSILHEIASHMGLE